MTPNLSTCPYCNADLPGTSPVVRHGRAVCPRCDEPLPARTETALQAGPPPAEPTMTAIQSGHPSRNPSFVSMRRRPNRILGLIILSGMAVIAVVALVFALRTQSYRRSNDIRGKGSSRERTILPPAELTGLGYLPLGTNIVAGLHVADLLADPSGKKLLEEPQPDWLQSALTSVHKWTGLKASDLDHVVFGVSLNKQVPQLAVVIQTIKPYAKDTIDQALAPAKAFNHRGKALYRFGGILGGENQLWCPGDRTMVLLINAAKKEAMDAIPLEPRSKLEALTPEVQKILTERINKQSVIWLAGRWEHTPALQLLATVAALPKEDAEALGKLQAVALELYPEKDDAAPAMNGLAWKALGQVQGPDARANQDLEKYLASKQFLQAKSYKVIGAPSEGADPESQWVIVQARMDLAALRNLGWKKK